MANLWPPLFHVRKQPCPVRQRMLIMPLIAFFLAGAQRKHAHLLSNFRFPTTSTAFFIELAACICEFTLLPLSLIDCLHFTSPHFTSLHFTSNQPRLPSTTCSATTPFIAFPGKNPPKLPFPQDPSHQWATPPGKTTTKPSTRTDSTRNRTSPSRPHHPSGPRRSKSPSTVATAAPTCRAGPP